MNKKTRLNYRTWFFIVGVCLILLGASYFVTSAEQTTKEFNAQTRTVTLEKGADKIADIKLNTPIRYGVIHGKDRLVAEMTISNYGTASPLDEKMDFYDLKRGNSRTTKVFTYKEKIFDKFEWIPSGISKQTLTYANGTQYNETIQEIKQIAVYKWIPLSKSANLGAGDITIGIFTDVAVGENIEWIPTYYGVEIPEFAEWFDSMNVGLVEYWSFNQSTGTTIIGNLSRYNFTVNNTVTYVTGKSGNAVNFSRANAEFGRVAGNISELTVGGTGTRATINLWVNVNVRSNEGTSPPTTAGIVKIGSDANDGNGNNCMVLDSVDIQPDKFLLSCPNTLTSAGGLNANQQYMVTFVVNNSDDQELYINGTLWASGANAGTSWRNGELQIAKSSQGAFFLSGWIDEMALWNRSLNATEISYLWDGGTGTFYSVPPTNNLSVTMTTVNNTQFVSLPATLNGHVVANGLTVANTSIYIDGTINQTNTSGYIGAYSFSIPYLANGNHTWIIKAFGNDSVEYTATNGTFNVNISVPPVNLTVAMASPANNTIITNFPVNLAGTVQGYGLTPVNTSLYIDGAINLTNISSYEGIYNFSLILPNGNHTWIIKAFGNDSVEYTATNGTFNVNISVFDPLPNQTASIPNFTMNYEENLNINFLDYFGNISFVNLTINHFDGSEEFTQSLVPYYIGQDNVTKYFLSNYFNIINNGNNTDINSYIFNRTIRVTPLACNNEGCVQGNVFNVTISDLEEENPNFLRSLSNGINFLPEADSLSFLQKLGIIFVTLFLITVLGFIATAYMGMEAPANVYLIGLFDVLIFLYFLMIGYISFWLILGLVVIILGVKYLIGRGAE